MAQYIDLEEARASCTKTTNDIVNDLCDELRDGQSKYQWEFAEAAGLIWLLRPLCFIAMLRILEKLPRGLNEKQLGEAVELALKRKRGTHITLRKGRPGALSRDTLCNITGHELETMYVLVDDWAMEHGQHRGHHSVNSLRIRCRDAVEEQIKSWASDYSIYEDLPEYVSLHLNPQSKP